MVFFVKNILKMLTILKIVFSEMSKCFPENAQQKFAVLLIYTHTTEIDDLTIWPSLDKLDRKLVEKKTEQATTSYAASQGYLN